MDYSKYSREELIEIIDDLRMINKELLSEKEKEANLDFPWTGNLGHWYFNIKSGTVVFNPLKVIAIGYNMDELPEKVDYKFFTEKLHPDDYHKTMNAMMKNMMGETDIYECEYRIETKDKKWKWFYDRGKVTQRDKQGKPLFAAGIVFDITEKKEREMNLEKQNCDLQLKCTTDALTGVKNRRAVEYVLENAIKDTLNKKLKLSIAIFDIDKFKNVNDTKGHVFGDKVISKVASLIEGNIRTLDSVGRYGGEEFLVVFPNTDKRNALSVCERIRNEVKNFDFGEDVRITISGGLSEYNGENIKEFIDSADKRLYEAKNTGRDKVV